MATYKTFKQLNGKTLAEHDIIYFGKLRHVVYPNFLRCTTSRHNTRILSDLGMSDEATQKFLKQMYRYEPRGGQWPEYNTCDYEAITRTALGIYALMDKDPYIEFKVRARLFVTVDLKPFSTDRVLKLNDEYTAHLNDDHIRIGCQKFPYSALKELHRKALKAELIK